MLGQAESVPYPDFPDASVTRIKDTLRDDAVGVLLRAHVRRAPADDPLGSTVHVDIRAALTFSVDDRQHAVPGLRVDSAQWRRFGWAWELIGVFAPFRPFSVYHSTPRARFTAPPPGFAGRPVTHA